MGKSLFFIFALRVFFFVFLFLNPPGRSTGNKHFFKFWPQLNLLDTTSAFGLHGLDGKLLKVAAPVITPYLTAHPLLRMSSTAHSSTAHPLLQASSKLFASIYVRITLLNASSTAASSTAHPTYLRYPLLKKLFINSLLRIPLLSINLLRILTTAASSTAHPLLRIPLLRTPLTAHRLTAHPLLTHPLLRVASTCASSTEKHPLHAHPLLRILY